jgi:hypothetical protein
MLREEGTKKGKASLWKQESKLNSAPKQEVALEELRHKGKSRPQHRRMTRVRPAGLSGAITIYSRPRPSEG